jgi:hypothetical protein
MGDLALGASHRRRDSLAHCGEIDPATWPDCGPALNIGADDGATGPCTVKPGKINSTFARQTPRGWRHATGRCRRRWRDSNGFGGRWSDAGRGRRRQDCCARDFASDQREWRADGNLSAWLDQQSVDHAVLEDFNLDCTLLSFDNGNDVAMADVVAWPF